MRYHCAITVSGLVQGVNLRSMIKLQASSLALTGTVANRSDGTVQIELEGEREAIQSFLRWLQNRPAGITIDAVKDVWDPEQRRYTKFTIIG